MSSAEKPDANGAEKFDADPEAWRKQFWGNDCHSPEFGLERQRRRARRGRAERRHDVAAHTFVPLSPRPKGLLSVICDSACRPTPWP
jgi:hypothetical protein